MAGHGVHGSNEGHISVAILYVLYINYICIYTCIDM